jgi:hypothetical protein
MVAVGVVGVTVVAMTVARDLIRAKGGKTVTTLMGR